MAYTLKNDPGILTPFRDTDKKNIKAIGRVTLIQDVSTTPEETQTLEIISKNEDGTTTVEEIVSAIVEFPDSERKVLYETPYDLTKILKLNDSRVYGKEAKNSIKVFTRSEVSSIIDPLNTVSVKNELLSAVYSYSSNIPFLPKIGSKIEEKITSVSLESPDATKYQFIEIDNPDVTIGGASDRNFTISIWVYLNSKKETILLTKGLVSSTQEYELKINSDMKIEFKTYDASANTYTITSEAQVNEKSWNHIVLTSSGNNWSSASALTDKFYNLYINKFIDNNYTIDCLTYDVTGTRITAENVFVGHNDSGLDNNMDGLVAEVAIWQDYYLKKREIAAIYDLAVKNLSKTNTQAIDPFRQGVSVTTNKHKNESIIYKLSSNNQREIGRPDHYIEQREFGQTSNYEGNIPFNDIKGRHKPYNLSTSTILSTETVQYPVVYGHNILEPLRDNGVLEPLAIRETILNNSADSPWQAHRISAEICGGNTNPEFGTILITGDIKRKEDQKKNQNIMLNNDCYFDASEQTFDPVYDVATSSTIRFPAPGFSSDVPQTEVLFDDSIDLTTNSIINEIESTYGILTGIPDSSRSNHLIKSAKSGFIYNNIEGTDSLAFGGLLRK